MQMTLKFLIALASVLQLSLCQAKLNRVLLSDPTALCLDGSPGAYYIERGEDTQTIILYFEGGGWCGDRNLASTIQNCYQRSKTNYGSSRSYPAFVNYSDGILSKSENNFYRNATRVILRYCDGSGHQGTRTNPVIYKDSHLYFRGNNITIAQLTDLQQKQGLFSKATNIIVTGGSAGGLAAFLWADYIKQKAATKNVVCAPDSGIFLDFATFDTNQNLYSMQFENLFKLSNVQVDPPIKKCVEEFTTKKYKCMLAEYMSKYVETPIFVMQSLYDSWSIQNILNIHCLTGSSLQSCSVQQKKYIEAYHGKTKQIINQLVSRKNNGAWAIACATHGFLHASRYYSVNYRVPMHTDNSIDFTLVNWVYKTDRSHVLIDEGNWPLNSPCSGQTFLTFK